MGLNDPEDTIFIYNLLYLLGWTIQYWDHILTFSDEVRYIWKAKQRGTHWFFLNRYIPFVGNIAVLTCTFAGLDSQSFWGFTLYHQILKIVVQIIVGVILALRTYAICGCDRRVLVILSLVAVGCIGAVGWSVSPHKGTVGQQDDPGVSSQMGAKLAAAWEALLFYDLVIFVITLNKTRRTAGGSDFVALILRDGAIYSGVMLLANAVNVSTYYVMGPHLKGCLATFASCISITMMSRLLLNLRVNTARDVRLYRVGDSEEAAFDGDVQGTGMQSTMLGGTLIFERECDEDEESDNGFIREDDRQVRSGDLKCED